MRELNTPLVSVGMTTYNQSEKLKKALDSIVNQTYKNLEIIISEDCSPCEETQKILEQYEASDSRIKVIHQKKNLGPPTNINFVLTQATGEYFMWADDDDLRDEGWVEALLEIMVKNRSAIVAVGNVVAINEDGLPVQYCQPLKFTGIRTYRLASYFLAEEEGGKACVVCGLFKTSFLQSIKPWGKYNKSFFGTDFLFALDCIQNGDVMVDPSVTIFKRIPVGRKAEKSKWNLSLIINRVQYLVNCSRVPNNWIDKVALTLLIPMKALKSIFNIVYRYMAKVTS